jgi:hypothetical protein
MGKKNETVNIAIGGFTAVQAGQIGGKAKPSKPAPKKADKDASDGTTVNVRSGNAKVGRQADVITGDLHIKW